MVMYPSAPDSNSPFRRLLAVEPIAVDVLRGDVVEARHRVHAVAVSDGEVVASAGDPSLFTLFRSSAKPLQALPIVRARPDLDDAEIAIASASHLHRPGSARARAKLAPEGERDRGRPRMRPGADADRAQLLGEARGDAAPVPRARLAERGLPARVAPVSAGADRRGRSGSGGRGCVRFRRPSTAAASSPTASRSSAWPVRSPGSSDSTAGRAWRTRCARGRSSCAATARPTRSSCASGGWVSKGGAEGLLCAARDGARHRAQGRGRGAAPARAGARGVSPSARARVRRAGRRSAAELAGRGGRGAQGHRLVTAR